MTRKIRKARLVNTGCLAAVLSAATIFTATPAFAQTLSLPTLQFPEVGTVWGCFFNGTCSGSVVTKAG